MDPDETLRLIRQTIKQMRVDTDERVRKAHALEIAEYFEALDEWMVKGGFPPRAWLDWTPVQRTPRGKASCGAAYCTADADIGPHTHRDGGGITLTPTTKENTTP